MSPLYYCRDGKYLAIVEQVADGNLFRCYRGPSPDLIEESHISPEILHHEKWSLVDAANVPAEWATSLSLKAPLPTARSVGPSSQWSIATLATIAFVVAASVGLAYQGASRSMQRNASATFAAVAQELANPGAKRQSFAPIGGGVEAKNARQRFVESRHGRKEFAWRADVENDTGISANVYVEVEWLDDNGFRLAYSNAIKEIPPGLHDVTGTVVIDDHLASQVSNFRLVKVNQLQ